MNKMNLLTFNHIRAAYIPALNIDKRSYVRVNTSDVMLVLIQNRSKSRLLGLISNYHTSC